MSARDLRDLEAVTQDLSIRHGVRAFALQVDIGSPGLDPDRYVNTAVNLLGHVDLAILTAGAVDEADTAFADASTVERLVRTNYLGTIQVMAAFARYFRDRENGRIVATSSIAAAAARDRNAVYSSAKAGLEVYAQGLRHALHGTQVGVEVYALGYVDTHLAFGHKLLFPVASPSRVARWVVRDLGRREGLRYYPRFWAVIVRCLRLLPPWITLRLKY